MLRRRLSKSTTESLLRSLGLRLTTNTKRCQSHSLVFNRQACLFSTGTTGLVKEQDCSSVQSTLPLETNGTVLISAAKEAQRLSDLAARCRPEKEKPLDSKSTVDGLDSPPREVVPCKPAEMDETTVQNAKEAAQALLFVTRLSSPLQDAIQGRETSTTEIKQQITSLHRAFLSVTSWCLDMVNHHHDPQVLDMAVQLSKRAHQLQLPFHIPLYIRLMNTVAEHYQPAPSSRTTAGGLILEIAERVTAMLGPDAIESSRFFRDPLETLVRCRRFGDVVTVLQAIEKQYRVDKDTLLQLLFALEVALRQREETATPRDAEETAGVLEILNLADPYLWKTLTSLTSLSGVWNRQKDKQRLKEEEELEKILEDDDYSTETVLPTRPSVREAKDVEPTRRRRKRSLDSYTKKDDLYLFRGWIYNSTSPASHDILPDITSQVEALFDGKGFRYSEELERAILNQNLDDEDLNDELFDFDDYDDEDVNIFSDDEDIFSDDDDSDLDE